MGSFPWGFIMEIQPYIHVSHRTMGDPYIAQSEYTRIVNEPLPVKQTHKTGLGRLQEGKSATPNAVHI